MRVETPTRSQCYILNNGQRLVHTIAICTANRREACCDTVERLIDMVAFPKITEIIIVNNGSTEDNSYIRSRVEPCCSSRSIKLLVYHEARRGLSFARNTVLERANGDIISFIDDDATPESTEWQRAVLDIFETNPLVAVCGGPSWLVPPHGKNARPWWRSDHTDMYFSCFYHHPDGQCHPGIVAGVNASYRFSAIGETRFATNLGWGSGKAQSLAGEDTLFNEQVCRGGWIAWFERRAIVLHSIQEERYKVGWVLRRAFIAGKTEAVFHVIRGNDSGNLYVDTPKQLLKSVIKVSMTLIKFDVRSLFSEICSIDSKLGVISMKGFELPGGNDTNMRSVTTQKSQFPFE